MRRAGAAALLLALAGCGKYQDFTLPFQTSGSENVRWKWSPRPGPVLGRGAEGSFDASDVLNPSVALHEGLYYNFYSGFDGRTWRTGLATSPDGLNWTRRGVVLEPAGQEGDYIAANGSALRVGNEFWYWYQAGRPARIGLARSADGRRFEKAPRPVLESGPRGSWDERGVADPYVLRAGGWFYMFYLGQDRARRQQLGVARSEDGVMWAKLRSNPVIEGEGLGEPAVWAQHGRWWMLFTERDRRERRRMGLARSMDGVRWEREPLVIAGEEGWNAQVVCDAEVEVMGEGVRVWFGGGDVARPDERLNGQIGVGMLTR